MTCAATDKWLLISDSQPILYPSAGAPDNGGQVAKWRAILDDIAILHPDASRMFFGGDLVHRGMTKASSSAPDQYYIDDWLADIVRSGLNYDRVFPIPGNHDRNYADDTNRPNTFAEYLKAFRRSSYALVSGNFLHIMLGTVGLGTGGVIDEAAFQWCSDLVREHQRTHNIIVHVHQPIKNTTTGSDTTDDWRISDSERFISMLQSDDGKVDLVVHGHNDHGLPGGRTQADSPTQGGLTDPNIVSHVQAYGAWHLNAGLHLPSYMNASFNPNDEPMSYCTAHLEEGSDEMVIRRWNTETNAEVTHKRFLVSLRHPARLSKQITLLKGYADGGDDVRGEWVPTVGFNGGNGSFVPKYLKRVGKFVRRGNEVRITCDISFEVNSLAGASSYFIIHGLPFPSDKDTYHPLEMGPFQNIKTPVTDPGQYVAYIAMPSAPEKIAIRRVNHTAGNSFLVSSGNFTAGQTVNLLISGSYFISPYYDMA